MKTNLHTLIWNDFLVGIVVAYFVTSAVTIRWVLLVQLNLSGIGFSVNLFFFNYFKLIYSCVVPPVSTIRSHWYCFDDNGKIIFDERVVPNMILVKVMCYVNVENPFLTFTKHIMFTRIMLGIPLGKSFKNVWILPILFKVWKVSHSFNPSLRIS